MSEWKSDAERLDEAWNMGDIDEVTEIIFGKEPTYTHRHNATGVRAYILAETTDGLLLMRHEHEGDTHSMPAAELDVLYTAAAELCTKCRMKRATHLNKCAVCFLRDAGHLRTIDGQDRREATAE